MKRKLATLMAMLVLTAVPTVSAFASSELSLKIDGKTITSETKPFIEDGNTLVPIRLISENLDCKVDWDANTKTVTITKGSTTLKLVLNSQTATVNGKSVALSAPAKSVNGSTYVPVRFVSENMDCTVGWDANTKTVTVNSGGTSASTKEPVVLDTGGTPTTEYEYVPASELKPFYEGDTTEYTDNQLQLQNNPFWRPEFIAPDDLTYLPKQYGEHLVQSAGVPQSELSNGTIEVSLNSMDVSKISNVSMDYQERKEDANGNMVTYTATKPTVWKSYTIDNNRGEMPDVIEFSDEPISEKEALELAKATNDGTRTLEQVIAIQRAGGYPIFKDWVYEDINGNSTLQEEMTMHSDLFRPLQKSRWGLNEEIFNQYRATGAVGDNGGARLPELSQDKLDIIEIWLEDYYKIKMTDTSITFATGVTKDLVWNGGRYELKLIAENAGIGNIAPMDSFDLKYERYPKFGSNDKMYGAKWSNQEVRVFMELIYSNSEIQWVDGLGIIPSSIMVNHTF